MTRTVADTIAQRLAASGCRHAFGVPGGEVLTLIDALDRAGIDFVLARHETAAGFMAEGAWQATGAPGVVIATVGPGVTNLVNPVANAQQDRVPLIVLTGAVDAAERASYTHQVFDHVAVLAPVVKASFAVVPGAAAAMIEKAVAIATQHPPGPVHLDIGVAVAASPEPDQPVARRAAPARAVPAATELEAARAALAAARRPLAILGLEVLTHRAEAVVAGFLAKHPMPVVTTYKAKGVVPEAAPNALGGAGLSPKADKLVLGLIAEADVILAIGYDPIEMRAGWRHPFRADQTVIDLAGWEADHGMHRADHLLVGDIGATLDALTADLAVPSVWADGRPGAVRDQLRAAFAVPDGWGPAQVIATARRLLPVETVATVDTGAHRILLSQMWTCAAPRMLFQSTGLCTMACALPTAIGYAQSLPPGTRPPVVVFVGDGGLEMGMGDLATVRDLGLPLIVVVLNDRSLALIEMKQRAMQLANRGVDFGWTDFAAVARAFGGHGVTVDGVAGLEASLADALARADRFSLISCEIDRRGYDGAF